MTDDKNKITSLTQLKDEKKSAGTSDTSGENPVSLLQEAIREVRVASAERAESAADIAELNRLKLEMLADNLESTFEESAAYDDLFDCALSNVPTPRLFIDAISHVAMARDQKTYRFVRNTRQGRVVLEESAETSVISDAVTRYMAERIVERQTLLGQPALSDNPAPKASLIDNPSNKTGAKAEEREGPWSDFFLGLSWFCIGAIAGAALLYLWSNGFLDGQVASDAAQAITE